MMIIENKYNLGQVVYLKHDPEQKRRMVSNIQVNPGNITYGVSCGNDLTWHYEMEISEEANILEKIE